MGIIDEIIPEQAGGAHRDHQKSAQNIKEVIFKNFKELKAIDKDELLRLRYNKFRSIGVVL